TSDYDPDGDLFAVTAVNGSGANVGSQFTLPSGALLTVQSDGSFTYNPNGVYPAGGTDTFTYTISDVTGRFSTATVTVTIGVAPVITSANNTTFLVGQANSFSVTTTGTPTVTSITETGSLPTG